MALEKSINLPSGITVTYWRVVSLTFHYPLQTAYIRIGGYSSKQMRDDGGPYITLRAITVKDPKYSLYFSQFITDSRANAYNYLKTTSEFENAMDI